jgi:hypothetical protein
MRITYVIYNKWTTEQMILLKEQGVKVENGDFSRIEIEDTPKSKQLLKLIDLWNLPKSVGTLYDKSDFHGKSLFAFLPGWVNGYPQSESNMEYLRQTYDLTKYCEACGVGAIQNNPFRLKNEPKWGGKLDFTLNWVFDEVFVRTEIYETVYKNLGLDVWPVLLDKKQSVIQSTVQLKLPITKSALILTNQPFEVCKQCHRKKYSPQIAGLFPPFDDEVEGVQIFKSIEYFGGGGHARKTIFISKILNQKLKSLHAKPILIPVTNR